MESSQDGRPQLRVEGTGSSSVMGKARVSVGRQAGAHAERPESRASHACPPWAANGWPGLWLVARMSSAWRVEAVQGNGKVVWFDLGDDAVETK